MAIRHADPVDGVPFWPLDSVLVHESTLSGTIDQPAGGCGVGGGGVGGGVGGGLRHAPLVHPFFAVFPLFVA